MPDREETEKPVSRTVIDKRKRAPGTETLLNKLNELQDSLQDEAEDEVKHAQEHAKHASAHASLTVAWEQVGAFLNGPNLKWFLGAVLVISVAPVLVCGSWLTDSGLATAYGCYGTTNFCRPTVEKYVAEETFDAAEEEPSYPPSPPVLPEPEQ